MKLRVLYLRHRQKQSTT